MRTHNIPHDLENLICVFAYGVRTVDGIVQECDYFLRWRGTVLSILLHRLIPTRPAFPLCGWRSRRTWWHVPTLFHEMMELNPYIDGNPFLPKASVIAKAPLWNGMGNYIISMVHKTACRKYRKYLGPYQKKLLAVPDVIESWNRMYLEVFSHPIFRDADSFFARSNMDKLIIERWILEQGAASLVEQE